MANLDHTCGPECVTVALGVSQVGNLLEPYGPGAPDHPDGYVPREGTPHAECATKAAWARENFPHFPQVLLAPRPGETALVTTRRIEFEYAMLAARPFVVGRGDPEDLTWGAYHTWLGDGTLIKFFPNAPPRAGLPVGMWWWSAGHETGYAETIEKCREAAGAMLGVPLTMDPRAFAALMGWDKPPERSR